MHVDIVDYMCGGWIHLGPFPYIRDVRIICINFDKCGAYVDVCIYMYMLGLLLGIYN